MKVLEIYLCNKTKKFLKKVEKSTFERVFNKIKELASDPYPSDAKRVILLRLDFHNSLTLRFLACNLKIVLLQKNVLS